VAVSADETPIGPLVCCVDDSDGARAALAVAGVLARRLGLELVLLHLEPTPSLPGVSAAPGAHERLVDVERSEGLALVERLATEAGIEDARTRVGVGASAAGILAVLDDERASLVAIGSRGRAGIRAAVLGSVSGEVAVNAPCPCVVVRPGTEHSLLGG
jgi:nucleotide-binding universal stress UspA family protein